MQPKSVLLTQASWTRWAFLSQDVLSKWSVGGYRGVQDVARPDALIGPLHANLLDRGTVPALQRESFASGFSLALQMIEGTFQFRATESPQTHPIIDGRPTSHHDNLDDHIDEDEEYRATPSASPSSVASPPPPGRVATTAPSSPMSLHGVAAPPRTSSHSHSKSVSSQVTTISGVVLSAHLFDKCKLRLKLKRAQRKISELITERDDICRELVRVGASSRLLPTLLSSSPSVTTIASSSSSPSSSQSTGERRRLFVARLLWSMTSTWQRLEREQREHQIRHVSDDTFELLNGWLTAAEVYSLRSTSSVLAPPGSRGEVHRSNNTNSRGGQQLRLLEDDVDLGAAIGVPSEQSAAAAAGHGSVYMPIFLCRRCREAGKGNVSYDPVHQRLIKDAPGRSSHHDYTTVPSPPRGPAAPSLTARLPAVTTTAAPQPPRTPPGNKFAVMHQGIDDGKQQGDQRIASPPHHSIGGVLPLIPNPTSLRQRHIDQHRAAAAATGGGNSPRQQRRLWESTAHGVYVPHR
ncbi:Hypothetical protein, putative [Bodo saltans]|uniref:Uncharacterized protein n=1 Tax=Bodo saltans TaxID=75058 RepID=A0A0S4J823_BODSA|nr:Hypothetical protein, putative [Bodo saltans]|eukprot:CUG86218.1 Hypothetical protein, putative [Bodo saltans]